MSDGFDDAVDHNPPVAAEDVDDLFAVRMRVRRTNRLARVDLDDAHGAVLRIHVVLGDDPAQVPAREVERLDAALIDDR